MENVIIPLWLFRARKIVPRLRLLLAGLLTITENLKSHTFKVGGSWLCKFTNRKIETINKNLHELSCMGILNYAIEDGSIYTITINYATIELMKESNL